MGRNSAAFKKGKEMGATGNYVIAFLCIAIVLILFALGHLSRIEKHLRDINDRQRKDRKMDARHEEDKGRGGSNGEN
jgi:heme exporter protein D